MVYVIMDVAGNYISPRETALGWYYLTYTGDTTGLMFYTNKHTALEELDALRDLDNNFILKYIDFKSIPVGQRIPNIKFTPRILTAYA